MKGKCRLCRENGRLEEGHIVPAFVARWLKDSSATGYLRRGMGMNLRAQDSAKEHWLCESCEDRLQECEKTFSENVFMPLGRGQACRFAYGPWMLKFSVSVSWRVLNYMREIGNLSHFTTSLTDDVDCALERWREFLLNRIPDPGPFEQHMLLMDEVEGHTLTNLPPNINWYLLRTIDLDAASSGSEAFVYTKMCRIILLGFIKINEPWQWQGTKIDVNHGEIGAQAYTVPSRFGTYMLTRAEKAGGFYKKVSPRQAAGITKTYRQNMQRAVDSETWRAIRRDVEIFGRKAFDDETPDNDG